MDRPWTRPAFLVLCLVYLPLSQAVLAQTRYKAPTSTGPTVASESSSSGTAGNSIVVSVVDEAGMPLDEQAEVRLYDEVRQPVVWASTKGRSEAQFDNVRSGLYEIEASAPGFKTVRQELTATSNHEAYRLLIVLPRDVAGAATDIKLGQILAPKPRKEAEKGIAAMNEGKLAQAQKHYEAAYKLAPTNANVNYLLGVLFVREKNIAEAEKRLNRAISLDSRHAGALTELGYVLLQKGDVAGASAVLEPAVSREPKSWRAHQLLAEAYFRQQQFEKARQQAELAIRGSKGTASEARLLVAQALAKLGRRQEAVDTLEAFLRDQPYSEAAPRARELIAMIRSSPPSNTAQP